MALYPPVESMSAVLCAHAEDGNVVENGTYGIYASKEKIADVDGFIAKSFFDEESQRRKIAELQRRVNDKLAMEKSRQRLEENKSFGEQIIESQRTK